jgi:competence protein ComEC
MLVIPADAVWRPLATAVGWVAHLGAQGLVWSADLVRLAPAASWRVAPPSAAACASYYAGLAIAYVAWRGVRAADTTTTRTTVVLRGIGIALLGASGLWILWNPGLTAGGDGKLHVTFLDVGQGDATLVVLPRGGTLLVDAGGLSSSSAFDIGDRVVAPVIRASGYRRIDRLAITHGDPDHIGGAMSVLREFRPSEIWEGVPVPRSDSLTVLRVGAQSLGAHWANVYAGDAVNVDGVEIVARHPSWPDWERQKVRNDDSLVLELRWRDVSVLLTGDIGRVPEAGIASGLETADGASALRPIRVVKIPHHGSLTSSSARFVEAIHPQIAVVSAGRSNHFGHPVPEVLERYRAVGAEVFRTDRDGAVFVETDGRTVSVRTYESTK